MRGKLFGRCWSRASGSCLAACLETGPYASWRTGVGVKCAAWCLPRQYLLGPDLCCPSLDVDCKHATCFLLHRKSCR